MTSSPTYDAFVSHNGLDKSTVERLCWALLDAGLRPWFDKWDLAPGDIWMAEIERMLESAPVILVCVGAHGWSPWQDTERQAAIHRAVTSRGAGVLVPILLPGAPSNTILPVFLRGLQPIDLRMASEWEPGVARLVERLRGRTPIGPRLDEKQTRPYRGLRPFTEVDAGWMFGREREEEQLLAVLRNGQRFIPVVGASGSGKSSLVRAGVMPAVRTGAVDGRRWHALVMRPGSRPCHALGLLLIELRRNVESAVTDLAKDSDELVHLRERFTDTPSALADAVDLLLAREGDDGQLLLVVDQFEEIFTESVGWSAEQKAIPSEAENSVDRRLSPDGSAFVSNLLFAANIERCRIRVMLTVRADFTGECLALADLARKMQHLTFALPPMQPEQLQAAIRRPALRLGYDVENALVDALVSSMDGQAGRLPLLQHTLDLLWDVRDRCNRRLRYLDFTEHIGSLNESVARKAEEVFAQVLAESSLKIEAEAATRRLFLRLIHLGDGTGDTRRQMPLAELSGDSLTLSVLDGYVRARLLVRDSYRPVVGAGTEQAAEIAHEALIIRWSRLRSWLNENREALRIRQQINLSAREWQQERSSDELWRGGRLARAWELVVSRSIDLSQLEREFLMTSRQAEIDESRARSKRARYILGGALVSAVVLLISLGFAIFQYTEATTLAAEMAELAEQEAFEVKKALEAQEYAALEQSRAEHLAKEAQHAAVQLSIEAGRRELFEDYNPRAALVHLAPAYRLAPSDERLQSMVSLAARSLDRLEYALPSHDGGVRALQYSRQGARMLTMDNIGSAFVWDAGTGREMATFSLGEPTTSVDFSVEDENVIVAFSGGRSLAQYDAVTGEIRTKAIVNWQPSLSTHEQMRNFMVGPLAGGRVLLTFDDTLLVVEAHSGTIIRTLTPPSEAPNLSWGESVEISHDGSSWVSAYQKTRGISNANLLVRWDANDSHPPKKHWVQPGFDGLFVSPSRVIVKTRFLSSAPTLVWSLYDNTTSRLGNCRGDVSLRGGKFAVSPEGTALFAVSDSNIVVKWDVSSGKCVAASKELRQRTKSIHVHGSDNDVLVVGDGAEVTRLHHDSLHFLDLLVAHQSSIEDLALRPQSSHFATADANGEIRVWSIGDPSLVHRASFRHGHLGATRELYEEGRLALRRACSLRTAGPVVSTLDERGDLLAELDGLQVENDGPESREGHVVRVDKPCDIWEMSSGRRFDGLLSSSRGMIAVPMGIFHGGRHLLVKWNVRETRDSVHSGKTLTLVELPSFRVVDILPSVEFSMASWDFRYGWNPGFFDFSRRRWDKGDYRRAWTHTIGSPDGRYVIENWVDGAVKVYDASSGELIEDLQTGTHLNSFTFYSPCMLPRLSPSGEIFVTAHPSGNLDLWETSGFRHLRTLIGHKGSVCGSEFAPSGTKLLTFDHNTESAFLWRTDLDSSGVKLLRSSISVARFSPDERFLVTGDYEGAVKLWDAETGLQLGEFRHGGVVARLAFSDNSDLVFSADNEDGVRVWRVGGEPMTPDALSAKLAESSP